MKLTATIKPSAKRDAIALVDGVYVVHVKAPAIEGKANEALIALMAKHLKIPKTWVRMTHGIKSRHKVLEILP